MSTLYERLGHELGIRTVTQHFYRKVLRDKRIRHFFTSVDMETQIAKQVAFLTSITGGPHHDTHRNRHIHHAPLLKIGLNDSHVDVVIELLGSTLKEAGITDDDIKTIAQAAQCLHNDI